MLNKLDYFSSSPLVAWFRVSVQQRIKKVTETRKLSPAGSVASAAILHMKDWIFGTKDGDWASYSVHTSGGKFGSKEDLFFSMPC